MKIRNKKTKKKTWSDQEDNKNTQKKTWSDREDNKIHKSPQLFSISDLPPQSKKT